MTDEQIQTIYVEGNAKSHTEGLRAVYEAGRNADARIAALENGCVLVEEEAPHKGRKK